jgi:enterochelin esterase-like enzyme
MRHPALRRPRHGRRNSRLLTLLRGLAAALLTALAITPAQAHPSFINPCSGPDDPEPCIVETAAPDLARLPAAGAAAWVAGERMVISWVGKADSVNIAGSISQLRAAMPVVADNVRQLVIQFKQAQQVNASLSLRVSKDGKSENVRLSPGLIGPAAAAPAPDSHTAARVLTLGDSSLPVNVWLPPGYRVGERYPILYLADGGGTSPGSLLAEPIRKGELPPVIVVGIEPCPIEARSNDCRSRKYIAGFKSGTVDGKVENEDFLAHEKYWIETVMPQIEAQYGAPPGPQLRAIGGASNGGVWSASMALRHPSLFGTAFVMSPGVRPAPHPAAKLATQFHVSAGLLERGFWWNAQCLAAHAAERGGTVKLTSYPAGHDQWMWSKALLAGVKDWLSPQYVATTPAPAQPATPPPGC